jgi:DNA polymerase
MTLHLDARQRAMLQEMGITVWAPLPTVAPAPVQAAPPSKVLAPPDTDTAPRRTTERAPAPAPAFAPDPLPAPQAVARSAPASPPESNAAPTPALRLHAPRPLYPTADPAQTPAGLGPGWLIVAESAAPADPLGGDVGRLLDNMLRAMQLHQHPRVLLAALERTGGALQSGNPVAVDLADLVASLQPAMVLVLGHVAARAALGRTEPLGRLRAEPHQIAGCPAVVTYDPAFLLRSQQHKAATWADLCRALALVRAKTSA